MRVWIGKALSYTESNKGACSQSYRNDQLGVEGSLILVVLFVDGIPSSITTTTEEGTIILLHACVPGLGEDHVGKDVVGGSIW